MSDDNPQCERCGKPAYEFATAIATARLSRHVLHTDCADAELDRLQAELTTERQRNADLHRESLAHQEEVERLRTERDAAEAKLAEVEGIARRALDIAEEWAFPGSSCSTERNARIAALRAHLPPTKEQP